MQIAPRAGCDGMSLLEAVLAVAIVGLVALLAVPPLLGAVRRAQAVRILTDVAQVQRASLQYRLDTGRFPETGTWGQAPEPLTERLRGVHFRRGDTRYLWWAPGREAGLMIYTQGDPRMLDEVAARSSWIAYRFGRYLYVSVATGAR